MIVDIGFEEVVLLPQSARSSSFKSYISRGLEAISSN